MSIFVTPLYTTKAGDLPVRAGIFIPVTLHIRQFCTSCWSVNILTAFYNFSEYSDNIKTQLIFFRADKTDRAARFV